MGMGWDVPPLGVGMWRESWPSPENFFEFSITNAGLYAFYTEKLTVARNRELGPN